MIDLGVRQSHLYSAVRLSVRLLGPGADEKVASGTGFFLADGLGSADVALITNRHVVDPGVYRSEWTGYRAVHVTAQGYQMVKRDEDARGAADGSDPVPFTIAWEMNEDVTFVPENPAEDVAVIPLLNATLSGVPALRVTFLRSQFAQTGHFGDDVSPGDFVVMSGYPRLHGEQVESPLILPGLVSSDPSQEFQVNGRTGRLFLLHAFSRQGLSGAPVYAVQRGLALGEGLSGPPHRPARLIGVNAGHLPADGDGPASFSYAVRSDAVDDALHSWLEALTAARLGKTETVE